MPLIEPILSDAPCDTLARLQLEIARRADQFPSLGSDDREEDRVRWLRAEAEVFALHIESLFRNPRPTHRQSEVAGGPAEPNSLGEAI